MLFGRDGARLDNVPLTVERSRRLDKGAMSAGESRQRRVEYQAQSGDRIIFGLRRRRQDRGMTGAMRGRHAPAPAPPGDS